MENHFAFVSFNSAQRISNSKGDKSRTKKSKGLNAARYLIQLQIHPQIVSIGGDKNIDRTILLLRDRAKKPLFALGELSPVECCLVFVIFSMVDSGCFKVFDCKLQLNKVLNQTFYKYQRKLYSGYFLQFLFEKFHVFKYNSRFVIRFLLKVAFSS